MPRAMPSEPVRLRHAAGVVRTAAAVAFLVAAVAVVWARFAAPFSVQDEALLLEYPRLVGLGKLPYRDYHAVYPVGWFAVLEGIYWIAGLAVRIERLVAVGLCIATVAAIWVLGRMHKAWRVPAAAAAVLYFLPLTASSWNAAVAVALWGIALADRGRRRAHRTGGYALLGFAASCHLTAIVPSLGAALVMAVNARAGRRRRAELRVAAIWWLVGALPLIVNVALLGFQEAVQRIVVDGARIRAGRYLPLGLMISDELFALVVVCFVVALFGIAVGLTERRRSAWWPTTPAAIAWALFLPAAGLQFVQRNDMWHGFQALILVAPFALLSLGAMSRIGAPVKAAAWSAAIAGVLLGGMFFLAKPDVDTTVDLIRTEAQHRTPTRPACGPRNCLPLQPSEVPFVQDLVRLVATLHPETVFVGPADLRTAFYNDLYLYTLLAPAKACSYFLEMNPLASNGPDSPLASELRRCDIVILTDRYGTTEPNESRRRGPNAPNDVVAKEFRLVGSFGPWAVYERSDRRHS